PQHGGRHTTAGEVGFPANVLIQAPLDGQAGFLGDAGAPWSPKLLPVRRVNGRDDEPNQTTCHSRFHGLPSFFIVSTVNGTAPPSASQMRSWKDSPGPRSPSARSGRP